MANHISDILSIWYPLKDEQEWVLASIIETEGSSYRKAGAAMLINDLGQYYGLLSGGCLESDIMRHARFCLQSQANKMIEYDMRDDADLAWQLGLGCGGRVKILLQPIARNNHYLALESLHFALQQGKTCYYQVNVEDANFNQTLLSPLASSTSSSSEQIHITQYRPQVALGVFGGGVDARPLVALAVNMGWIVYLVDHRSAYARDAYFPGCERIIRQPCHELTQEDWLQRLNAAVVMTHSVEQDAQALALLESSAAEYIGLLGPMHRTERVFNAIAKAPNHYKKALWNPMGLKLGGELPESIALATCAEIHAVLFDGNGESMCVR
ncbi:XdhC family protein [Alteromonas sp. a30]|nr:XdhC family protein [Alteromonas sp. a30]